VTADRLDADDVVEKERQRIASVELLVRRVRVLCEHVEGRKSVERQDASTLDARDAERVARRLPAVLHADAERLL